MKWNKLIQQLNQTIFLLTIIPTMKIGFQFKIRRLNRN